MEKNPAQNLTKLMVKKYYKTDPFYSINYQYTSEASKYREL